MVDEYLSEFAATSKSKFEFVYRQADYRSVPEARHLFRPSKGCFLIRINVSNKRRPTFIFLHTPAEIPGKCDWGYSDSPDPLNYVLGQFLTFFINDVRRRSGYGNCGPLAGSRRKQAGLTQGQICPVNLASIDARLLFHFANRRKNIASFEHSHCN